ncbi:MAG: hypothetical protein E6I27_06765 [Chloroflexi bacterium]|nr:MAG: hypothetical protein E6I96_07685 [Chloroflexota bacterium]TMF38053.1 MAG: hypothetical protein E6I27_06765 [Chloroflexota bacterium]
MAWRVIVLSILIFVAAFGAHEVLHLLVIYAVGSQGSIIVRPWRLGYLDFSIYALHAQPAQQLDVVRQSLVNFFGPFLAALPFAGLLIYVREPIPLAALIANVVILVFYAVIELGDVLLESVWKVDVPLLTTPEFNYGVPLLVIVVTAVAVVVLSTLRGSRIPD